MNADPQDLETTAGDEPAERKPTRSSRSRPADAGDGKPPQAKPRRRRDGQPIHPVTRQLHEAAQAFLARQYGTDGQATTDAVCDAIKASGREIPPDEPELAAISQIAEAAQTTLLDRRGLRDLGTSTQLGMVIRQAAER